MRGMNSPDYPARIAMSSTKTELLGEARFYLVKSKDLQPHGSLYDGSLDGRVLPVL